MASPIPVTIVTGFLGAGKTTLLNALLRGEHGLRMAVLVNDFGAVNIDTQLVVGVEGETLSLANGCICCTIRNDLLETAQGLLRRAEPPEHIVIETSGVSDPWAVADTFLQPETRQQFHLDGIITVVDAEQAGALPDYSELVKQQLAAADLVVLNKIDLVDEERRKAVQGWVRGVVPRARLLEASHGVVPLDILLGVGKHRMALVSAAPAAPHDHDHDHDHSAAFGTWSFRSEQPLDRRALWDALTTLPPTIFRGKGILDLADTPRQRTIVHLVGRRVTLARGEPWGDEQPHSQLVFIGSPNAISDGELHRRLAGTVARSLSERLGSLVRGWLGK